MHRLSALVLALVILGTGCALRPRYSDFINTKTVGPETLFVLSSKAGAPLGNVRVELSEGKSRFSATTKADGTFALPVDKKYLSEDPVLVVTLPPGIDGYAVTLAPAPTVVPEPETVPAAPTPEKS